MATQSAPEAPPERKQLWTMDDVAYRVNKTVRWVKRKVANREIPYFKLGDSENSPIRFDPDEIERWLDGLKQRDEQP